MRFVLPALILASAAVACAFALFSNDNTGIAPPDAVFKGSARRVMADLLQRLDAMKPADVAVLIRAAAVKHRVPAALVKSIVAAESNFHSDAVSPKGAIGLMQLMPETAEQFGADPYIPEQNIDAGTSYLHFLMHKYRRYGNSLSRVIAAYNAGPGAVDRYRGIPPFRETRGYVARVMGYMRQYRKVLHHPDFFSAHDEFPDAAHEFTEPPCDSMRSAPRVKRPHAGAWRFCSQVAPQRSHAAFWLRLCCFVGQVPDLPSAAGAVSGQLGNEGQTKVLDNHIYRIT
jgi:hypothetical protein